jgi:transcriptional regulator with GAF, ATPase, and Fis domain
MVGNADQQLTEILSRLVELQEEGLTVREEEQELLEQLHPLVTHSALGKDREVEQLRHQVDRYRAERDVLRLVAGLVDAAAEDAQSYVTEAVRAVEQMPRVEKGCIVLFDGDGGADVLETIRVAPAEREMLGEQISQGIVARVRETGQTLYCDEAERDADWKDLHSVQALNMKTVLCCPIPDQRGGPVRGALYLENRTRSDAFPAAWREAVRLLATQMSRNLGLMERTEAVGGDPTAPYRTAGRFEDIVGTSACTARWLADIERQLAGDRARPVLITGETGVGKGLTAAALHRYGSRRDGPFIRVNLAALSETLAESDLFGVVRGAFTGAVEREGLFQQAHGGVIFLDEIGEISPHLQQKLLGVLDDYRLRPLGGKREVTVDAWVIAATNSDLDDRVDKGLFREDLRRRLARRQIVIPPLRERPADVEALVQHFVQREATHRGSSAPFVSPDLTVLLQSMELTGNVRELETLVELTMEQAEGTLLNAGHLRRALRRDAPQPPGTLDHGWEAINNTFQEQYLRWAWERWGPSAANVARELNMHRASLYRACRRLGVEIGGGENGG